MEGTKLFVIDQSCVTDTFFCVALDPCQRKTKFETSQRLPVSGEDFKEPSTSSFDRSTWQHSDHGQTASLAAWGMSRFADWKRYPDQATLQIATVYHETFWRISTPLSLDSALRNAFWLHVHVFFAESRLGMWLCSTRRHRWFCP